MLIYSLAFCFSIEILPTVLALANTFTVGYFFLVEDRTLHNLQITSDGASVLEFWTVSIIDINFYSEECFIMKNA